MDMTRVQAAQAEAHRFLQRYRELVEAIQALPADADRSTTHACPRQAGALRRASLDLTRALAAMRRRGG